MSHCPYHDPFKDARKKGPVLPTQFDGEPVPMILGLKDVRKAARDFKTFSSNAPFRIPIPAEEDVRSVRQFPLEVDPPDHTDYRKIVEPFFKRPTQPEYITRVENLIGEILTDACQRDSIEIVREFAIPLQSRALTYLLNMPESEANVWIQWGTHVFRDESGVSKGAEMEAYCHQLLDSAAANPGDDFFSALVQAEFQGRPLTRDEMLGFANITFAGGRDTIINTVAVVIAYIAEHPSALDTLRENPKMILTATEELIRFTTPLTHIGRVCPVDTDVHGKTVKAGDLVSLCWASANFDETVFDSPEEVRIDRKPNPHIAFGNGTHNCLGAPHSRLLVRTLLRKLCELTSSVKLIEATPKVEQEADYERNNAYESLTVQITPSSP
ncbi:MAG: cytochrome P450 [Verrucomicrobiae bacterium]|nr:cytochrome P450 [Verrucomicrobiae bacterium]NNJ43838.1 cytochrome P450 [Akkermansiaceae bacterium]